MNFGTMLPALLAVAPLGAGCQPTASEGTGAHGDGSGGAGAPSVAPPSTAGGAGTNGVGGDGSSAAGAAAVAGAGSAGASPTEERALAKLEPASGQSLLLVGQDTAEIESYAGALGWPAGVMLYGNVWDGLGVLQPSDFGGFGSSDFAHWSQHAQPLVLQIGLDLDHGSGCGSCQSCARAGYLEQLASGAEGPSGVVRALADAFAASARPILLRVGYEFDAEICPGGFGKYPYDAYREAFRRVVELVRERGADNVAFVWNAWAYQSKDPASQAGVAPWGWYPGDEYVDWIGVSVFPGFAEGDPSEGQQADKRRQLAMFAQTHGKPLMIAEASPRARFTPALGEAAWRGWYEGVFAYVEEHDVKAFSYINMNWEALPQWAGRGWGDSRVQGSPIETSWRAALADERFLSSSSRLYQAIGFP